MIDEEHGLVMTFDGTDAKIYENIANEESFACVNPSSHGQIDGLVVVTCDAGALAVVIEEDENTEHTFTSSILTLAGNGANYVWRAEGDVIVGFEPGTSNYAIIELDDSGETSSAVPSNPFVFAENICDMQLESHEQDILAMTLGGTFVALDHEGTELKSIALDFSTASTCDDFIMAAADKTAIVVDNSAQKGYELDVDESESESATYHLHEDFNLDVSDIASMIVFHEKEESGHEH
jgi:hypothetical protein